MIRHEVFATEEEAEKIRQLAETAAKTPVIAFSSEDALAGRDAASLAWDDLYKEIYKAAMAHGLPEITGWYGMDLKTREFVSV